MRVTLALEKSQQSSQGESPQIPQETESPQEQETQYNRSNIIHRNVVEEVPAGEERCWRKPSPAGKRPEGSFRTLRIYMKQKGCTRTVLAVSWARLTGNGKPKGTVKSATPTKGEVGNKPGRYLQKRAQTSTNTASTHVVSRPDYS